MRKTRTRKMGPGMKGGNTTVRTQMNSPFGKGMKRGATKTRGGKR